MSLRTSGLAFMVASLFARNIGRQELVCSPKVSKITFKCIFTTYSLQIFHDHRVIGHGLRREALCQLARTLRYALLT
jgi:hypothetical protein